MKQPHIWTIRDIEGKMCECYCTINWEYDSSHIKHSYQLVQTEDGFVHDEKGHIKTIRVPNTRYNPHIKKPRKPLYCERKPKPSEKCHKNHCPHFAYRERTGDEDDGLPS
jgi:hypothetical protein